MQDWLKPRGQPGRDTREFLSAGIIPKSPEGTAGYICDEGPVTVRSGLGCDCFSGIMYRYYDPGNRGDRWVVSLPVLIARGENLRDGYGNLDTDREEKSSDKKTWGW